MGAAFYVANPVLITTVIGLVENKPLLSTWDECFRVYLPYFAAGLAVFPPMLLARHYFKTFGSGANQRT